METTIKSIHTEFKQDELTSTDLVNSYLNRIEAFDKQGPNLNGIITVNHDAHARAAHLDVKLDEDGPVGPLHGVPVLVKDQAMTEGLTTTFGSEAFSEYIPNKDATIVSNLKEAGAIVLAKTNLPDWAAGFVGHSSAGGQTKNPYALDRDPGGSSSGTAAGIAANFATVGIGEDTGGSIRVPVSCCNLFGIRATTGLVSRTGFSPLVVRQDTPGPMTRTVDDLARVLQAIIGYDPEDEWTGRTSICETTSYLDAVQKANFDEFRIGILREVFGEPSNPAAAPVNTIIKDALQQIEGAGLDLIDPVSIDDLQILIEETSLYKYQSKRDLNNFLRSLPHHPMNSIDRIFESGQYDKGLALIEKIVNSSENPTDNGNYWRAVAKQEELQRKISDVCAEHNLDGIMYPTVQTVPRKYKDIHRGVETRDQFSTNTLIASQSSCPAVSMPAGLTDQGLPVGLEVLGSPFTERRLISIAAAFESVVNPREPPSSTPSL